MIKVDWEILSLRPFVERHPRPVFERGLVPEAVELLTDDTEKFLSALLTALDQLGH